MPTLRKWIKTIMQSLETKGHWSIGVSLDKDLTWIITAAVPADVFSPALSVSNLQVIYSVRNIRTEKAEAFSFNHII